uniref:Tc1-like transposase DDE domain-containing protein n=1 Tax=Astatotilapia calliptera TaxID=8154 RepID=A0A3P8N8F6_ASTCA
VSMDPAAAVSRCLLQNLGLERIEWPTCSPELNPTEHLVTNITTLAVLRQTLVQEWDAIARQCVTKVVTSMRRRCLAVVNVYDSSTCY